MKKLYKTFWCLFSIGLLLIFACKKETPEVALLEISDEDLTLLQQPFIHEAGSRTVALSTSLSIVRASSSADWCNANIVEHNGTSLRIEVFPNEGFAERTAEITVFGQGVETIVIPIKQWANQPALIVAENNGIEIVDGELDFTLHITSNVDFTLEIPDWISDAGDNTPYIGSKVYTFVASSITPGSREGEIKVITEDHQDLNVTIPVSQLQNVLYPTLTDFTPASGEKGETIVLNGANFGTNSDLVTVYFNALEAEVVSVSDNAIEVIVPRAPGNPCTIKVDILGDELTYPTTFDYVPSWGLYTVTGDGTATFRGGTLAQGRVKARYISLDGNGNIFASHRDEGNNRYVIRINEGENIVEAVGALGAGWQPNATTIGPNNVVYLANDQKHGTSYYEMNPANNWVPVERTITYPAGDGPPAASAFMYRLVYNPHDGHLYGSIGHAEGPYIKVNPNNQQGQVIYRRGTVNPTSYALSFDPINGTDLYTIFNNATLGYGLYRMDISNATNGFTKLNHATTTLVNSGSAGLTNDLEDSGFGLSWDAKFGPDGYLYVSDNNNHIIRKIDLTAKTIETIIGVAGQPGTADGKADQARLNNPRGLAWNSTGTTMYISDFGNSSIRKWTLD